MKHIICIRSAYTDGDLSYRRLDLSRRWCIPSLAAQTLRTFSLLVEVDDNDPFLPARKAAFESVGVPIEFTTSGFGLDTWAYKTRLDDDDVLAPDFIARIAEGIARQPSLEWYSFPEGYLLKDGQLWKRSYLANQFVTRFCGMSASPYDLPHTTVKGHCIIDQRPAWCWIRHADNKSPEKDQHRGCYGEPRPAATLEDVFHAPV